MSGWGTIVGLALILASSLPLEAAVGGGWTNLAGHVIQGVPVAMRGKSVEFTHEGEGRVLSYPLSVFTPSEQERIRLQLKDVSIPSGLKAAHEFSMRTIRRSRLLHAGGELSDSGLQEAMDGALSAFRKQAEPFLSPEKLSPERLELILQAMLRDPGEATLPR